MVQIKRLLLNGGLALWLACCTLLTACDSSDSPLRIEGRFKNLNQGEFYLYDAVKGWKDTIPVRDGRFSYQRMLKDTAIFSLMFPNYSELPVFVRPGAKIKITGDASHLRETEVEGTEDNELMTLFRLKASKQTPPETTAAARKYIEEHSGSLVSHYLLERYFLQTEKPNYQLADTLCRLMLAATPDNGQLVRLQKQLTSLASTPVGTQLPAFKAIDTENKEVTEKQLIADANIVLLWASWNNESRNILRRVWNMRKKHPGRIALVCVCLDVSKGEAERVLQRDTITCPNICEGEMWQSPTVLTMGFATIPANIIADKNGKIIARDLSTPNAIEDKLNELLK